MSIFVISQFLTAFTSFLLGFLVFLKNKHSKENILWFMVGTSVSLWSFSLGMEVSSENYSTALFWNKILNLGAILIPIFFYHFIAVFLNKERDQKRSIFLGYVLSILLIIVLFVFTNLFIKGVPPKAGFKYWVEIGPNYYYFFLFFIIYILRGLYLLLKTIKESSDVIQKMQAKYILAAIFAGFCGGITNFFPQLFNIYPFGSYFVMLYVIIVSYAVFKHQLFNIKIIATELLTFTIWIFVLTRALLAETFKEVVINGCLLIFLFFAGFFLIRSVLKEVRLREQLAEITKHLEKANAKLKQLDQEKSDFLSIASHQLRTPMTVIKGYISILREGTLGKMTPDAQKSLDKVYVSNERLIKLINDLLDLSRIESGNMKYSFEKQNLAKIVKDVSADFIETAKDRRLYLNYQEPEEAIPELVFDADYIRQVIMNLLDNAIKYTNKGGVDINLTSQEQKVLISIKDTGAGISEEDKKKLFQRYHRGVQEGIKGLGIGLYLAKKIVEDHHGRIWVESEGTGKGSTFFVELPVS